MKKYFPSLTKALVLLTGFSLTACITVGPDYRRPDLKLPSGWQEPQTGSFADINKWWTCFEDPALTMLLEAAQKDNPTLAKAAAAIEKARAERSSASSGFWPTLDVGADADESGSLKNSSGTSRSAGSGLDASWELDLFGKTRRSSESAAALLEARRADWHDARISLAAEVATDYVDYRACRIKQNYYEQQAASQEKTGELTQISVQAGFTAPADGRLAEASAAGTRSTALSQKTECEVTVKALVALTGMPEPDLRRVLGQDRTSLPQPEGLQVTSVPANLLRQRPDIVSAERSLASASALIGVAEAARWPSLNLSGAISLLATQGASATAPWSFGSALTLPIFSGGKITADIQSARADYDSALADYKQTVRDAVKEVEQALVRLDSMARREEEARKSAQGYRDYLTATEQNWRFGGASLLDLETARRSAISSEVNLLELRQNRLLYWIALYKAVGGGWHVDKGEGK